MNFAGGTKDNAITRECEMSLIYADSAEAQKAEKLACDLAEVFADEITSFEPDFSCEIAVTEGQSAMAVRRRCKGIRKSDASCSKRNLQTKHQDERVCRCIV